MTLEALLPYIATFSIALFLLVGAAVAIIKTLRGSTPTAPSPSMKESEWTEKFEGLKVKLNSLELEQADLREYVTRGVKKMSSRKSKAEELLEALETATDQPPADDEMPQQDMFQPPVTEPVNSQKPRLTRIG